MAERWADNSGIPSAVFREGGTTQPAPWRTGAARQGTRSREDLGSCLRPRAAFADEQVDEGRHRPRRVVKQPIQVIEVE